MTLISITLRIALLAIAAVPLLSGCAGHAPRPDLARLYAPVTNNPQQPPIILIHGLMGSTLVDRESGMQIWPGSLRKLAFSDYRSLAQLEADEHRKDEHRQCDDELFHRQPPGGPVRAALLYLLNNSFTRGCTTAPPCVSSVSRVISSAGSTGTAACFAPSLPSRCSRKVMMFFAYIWLA